MKTQGPKHLRSSEVLFASHKGHFFVSASRWEQKAPESRLLAISARIVLEAWRAHRSRCYEDMKDGQGAAAVRLRNQIEFSDEIGPTEAYFRHASDSPDSQSWATRLIAKAVELNGRVALERLADERRAAVASKDSMPPLLRPLLEKPLIFQRNSDVLCPWVTESDGHHYEMHVGLFPDELLYTLVSSGVNLGSFNNWPPQWKRK